MSDSRRRRKWGERREDRRRAGGPTPLIAPPDSLREMVVMQGYADRLAPNGEWEQGWFVCDDTSVNCAGTALRHVILRNNSQPRHPPLTVHLSMPCVP